LKLRVLVYVLSTLLWCATARADVQRFALIIGNNRGQDTDTPLQYAESDAEKIHAVMRDLGGFDPLDMVLLKGADARTVRRALIAMNDRIRNGAPEALLFVYYSGHADMEALRIANERVELAELSQLVRGSAAKFRLMVLDACRSGQVTRRKGGLLITPFAVPPRESLPGEGLAFLTASAATEDAQESDELRGSFFTHALVSGLLGAADSDKDGAVALDEAYRYAYDSTLRGTSRTLHGVQHPSFEYDFRGQGTLVLTHPGAASGTRGTLQLPSDLGFLVLQDHSDGPVVAELGAKDGARSLSLRPGRYFLRGRGHDVLLEGSIKLSASQTLMLDPASLDRVEYARLVRKGGQAPRYGHALDLGPFGQTYATGRSAACWGGSLGYALELERLSVGLRLGACGTQTSNDLVRAQTYAYDLSLSGMYTWDLPYVSVGTGLAAGILILHQSFETRGSAPDRASTAPYVGLLAELTVALHGPWFLRLNARGATELANIQAVSGMPEETRVLFALRASLLVGVYLGAGQGAELRQR
jgi:hypothetical protein